MTLPVLALLQRQTSERHMKRSKYSLSCTLPRATDNSVWIRKKSPPQMAIYKTLWLVGPAHTASN